MPVRKWKNWVTHVLLMGIKKWYNHAGKQIGTFFFFLKRFYLFIFRERETEGEREGEKHQYVVASCEPPGGDCLKPRHVPRLGIQSTTLWFTGQHSIH